MSELVGWGRWGAPMAFVRGGKRQARAFRGRPLKLMMFNESLTGGGAERNLIELATHFDPSVVDPVVVIYHRDLHYAPQLDAAGIKWRLVEKTRRVDGPFLGKLAVTVRQERPDVVHSFLPTPNFWMKLARLAGGRPPLVVFLGSIEPSAKDFLLDRALRATVSAVIVNSTTAQREAVERFGFSPERVHLIYNGVDLERFSPGEADASVRRSLGVPEEGRLLTVVARVRGEKNHACLVRALVALQRQGRLPADLHGRFVGRLADESLAHRLRADLRGAGLGERFTFCGPRSDIPQVLRASDLLVLPSLYEGCPNAVQEAMACGLPVIASAVSDNALLVKDGDSGRLFPSDDAGALAAALADVLGLSPAARRAMGAAGRRIIEGGYSMAAYVRATLAVYHRALEQAPSS